MILASFFFPIDPAPASRPRVPRFGKPYYVGPYKRFRDAAPEVIREAYKGEVISGPIDIAIEIVCKRPKTTKLDMPKPDWDNYAKAVCDQLNGVVFEDDRQIRTGTTTKRWSDPDEEAHIKVVVQRADIQTNTFWRIIKALGHSVYSAWGRNT